MRKHWVLFGTVIGLIMVPFSWAITSGFNDILLSFLSAVLTICLVAFTIYLVQRNSKFNND